MVLLASGQVSRSGRGTQEAEKNTRHSHGPLGCESSPQDHTSPQREREKERENTRDVREIERGREREKMRENIEQEIEGERDR